MIGLNFLPQKKNAFKMGLIHSQYENENIPVRRRRAEVHCLTLNFKISKLGYWNIVKRLCYQRSNLKKSEDFFRDVWFRKGLQTLLRSGARGTI